MKTKYFKNDVYLYDDTKKCWINLSEKGNTQAKIDTYVKGMIRHELESNATKMGIPFDPKAITGVFNTLMQRTYYEGEVLEHKIDRTVIQFNNAMVDLKTGTSTPVSIPEFTPYQIKHNYYETLQTNWNKDDVALVDKFLKAFAGTDDKLSTCLLEVIGAAMAPKNYAILPILYSPFAGTGKGTINNIVRAVTGLSKKTMAQDFFEGNVDFNLHPIKGQLAYFIDELPSQLPADTTEKLKSLIDDSSVDIEIQGKGTNKEYTLNTQLFFASSNNMTRLHSIDGSIKHRMIWMHMQSTGKEFTGAEIMRLYTSQTCIEYWIHLATKAIIAVEQREAARNERFTLPDSNAEYWASANASSKAIDIIESNMILSGLWDSRTRFISNEDIKPAVQSYISANRNERITEQGFKDELIRYIHSNKLGQARIDRFGGKRGIIIEWNKKDGE